MFFRASGFGYRVKGVCPLLLGLLASDLWFTNIRLWTWKWTWTWTWTWTWMWTWKWINFFMIWAGSLHCTFPIVSFSYLAFNLFFWIVLRGTVRGGERAGGILHCQRKVPKRYRKPYHSRSTMVKWYIMISFHHSGYYISTVIWQVFFLYNKVIIRKAFFTMATLLMLLLENERLQRP